MKLRYFVTAAAASALLAGAVYAQDATNPAPADQGAAAAPADTSASTNQAGATVPATAGAAAAPATDASAPPAEAAAGSGVPTAAVQVATTTNGPIPDTPENRAKYGQPLSNAGKHSKAKGN
jgi:hypothetical protein